MDFNWNDPSFTIGYDTEISNRPGATAYGMTSQGQQGFIISNRAPSIISNYLDQQHNNGSMIYGSSYTNVTTESNINSVKIPSRNELVMCQIRQYLPINKQHECQWIMKTSKFEKHVKDTKCMCNELYVEATNEDTKLKPNDFSKKLKRIEGVTDEMIANLELHLKNRNNTAIYLQAQDIQTRFGYQLQSQVQYLKNISQNDFITISSQISNAIIQENNNNNAIITPQIHQISKRARTMSQTSQTLSITQNTQTSQVESHTSTQTHSMTQNTQTSQIGSHGSTLKMLTSLNPITEKLSFSSIIDEFKKDNKVHIKYSLSYVFLQFDIKLFDKLSCKEVSLKTIFSNCKHYELLFFFQIKYEDILGQLAETITKFDELTNESTNEEFTINSLNNTNNELTHTQLQSMVNFFQKDLLNEQILYDLQQVIQNELFITLNIFFWNKETMQPELFFEGNRIPYSAIHDKIDWNDDNALFVVNSGEEEFNAFTLYQRKRE